MQVVKDKPRTVRSRARIAERFDWPAIMEELNSGHVRVMRLRMGTPGSAQATRCRVLHEWRNVEAWTEGPELFLRLKR